METIDISVIPSGAACGVEIGGVDASRPLDARTVAAIRAAWLEHLVIVLRDQDLGPDDQKRLCGYFGQVGAYHRPRERQNPNYASDTIMLVSNVRENGQPIGSLPDGEMMWHSDTAYNERPHMATTLFAVEVPTTGGNTLFANQYRAYEALPERLKTRLAGAMAMNAYEFGTTVKTFAKYDREKVPHHAHPVFRKHPETGRTAVYVCPLMTEELVGFPEAESRAILEEIYALQAEKRFVYPHKWRVGDLVMWDNRCLLHARTDFSREERRLLRRVTIEDKTGVMAA
jgi:taurine dioxygenase